MIKKILSFFPTHLELSQECADRWHTHTLNFTLVHRNQEIGLAVSTSYFLNLHEILAGFNQNLYKEKHGMKHENLGQYLQINDENEIETAEYGQPNVDRITSPHQI